MENSLRSPKGWYIDCVSYAQSFHYFELAEQLLQEATLAGRTGLLADRYRIEATNQDLNRGQMSDIGLLFIYASMDEWLIPYLYEHPDIHSREVLEKSDGDKCRRCETYVAKQALWACQWLPGYHEKTVVFYKQLYGAIVLGWRGASDEDAKEIFLKILPMLRKPGEESKLMITMLRTQGAGAGMSRYEDAMSEVFRYRAACRDNKNLHEAYMVLAHGYINVLGPDGLQPIFPKR